ncbi:MAG: hypothetical protein U0354_12580 [Candidatus Sericytochromatia bacterium]
MLSVSKTKLFIIGALISFTSSCVNNNPNGNTNIFGGGGFNLKGLIVTKILTDKTSVSSSLKWNTIGGADHYELSRLLDNGSEVIIRAIIPSNATTYSDPNLKQDSSYQYVLRAVDSRNKMIAQEKTPIIKPINSNDLQATEVLDLKALPDINKVTRETVLKWSSVSNADLYYASITNDAVNKQIFGVFTKSTSINTNSLNSPENPSEIIKLELPILTDGLAISVQHKFSVYTIKFNDKDVEKATAIGIRQSPEVNLII